MGPALRAKLLTADGSLARMLGDFSRAEQLLELATGIWRDLDDAEGLAWALSHLGLVKQWLGQLDTGVQLLEESLALRLPSGDDRGIARSLFNLAVAEDFRGNYGRAAQLYEQTLEVQRRVGDTWGIGRVLGYWAKVLLRGGEHARAESSVPRGAQAEQPGCRQMGNRSRAVRIWRCRMDAIRLRQSLRVAQAEPGYIPRRRFGRPGRGMFAGSRVIGAATWRGRAVGAVVGLCRDGPARKQACIVACNSGAPR